MVVSWLPFFTQNVKSFRDQYTFSTINIVVQMCLCCHVFILDISENLEDIEQIISSPTSEQIRSSSSPTSEWRRSSSTSEWRSSSPASKWRSSSLTSEQRRRSSSPTCNQKEMNIDLCVALFLLLTSLLPSVQIVFFFF